MHVSEFYNDIQMLMNCFEEEGLNLPEGHKVEYYDEEFIPFGKFYNHFVFKPKWKVHMRNFDSPFMKLL